MAKKQNKQNISSLKPADYERLGRIIELVFLSGYANRSRLLWMSFAKGIISGVGGVIGATIVIGLLLWSLSAIGTIPLIGPLAESIERTIDTSESTQ